MSAIGLSYPQELPIDSVREIVRIVRAGKLIEERAEFAHAAWNVQGYLQAKVVGEPRTVIGDVPVSDELACESLLRADEDVICDRSAPSQLPLPASLLLGWLVRKLLESLISNRSEQ